MSLERNCQMLSRWRLRGSVTQKNSRNPAGLLPLSPHLTSLPSSFSLPVICQAAQLLALSPPAQDRLDFSPAKKKKKELCSMCHSQGLLTSARLFPFHYPSAQSFSPTLVLSAYLQISAYFFKNPTSRSCCRFICNFRSLVSLSVSVNLF